MINVLIVDDNINYAVSLMNYINSVNKTVRVCQISSNGKEALETLSTEDVDIIVLDLKMPQYTGIDVLMNLKEKEKYNNSIIVISGELDHINKLHKNNMIHSILYKPIGMDKILEEINKLFKEKEKNLAEKNLKKRIFDELLFLNYDLSQKGTIYLADCIYYIMNTPSKDFNNLKGEIYPIISKYHCNSIHNIKCNITRATKNMYLNCEIEKIKMYFHCDYDYKPDVRTVIRTIINKLTFDINEKNL